MISYDFRGHLESKIIVNNNIIFDPIFLPRVHNLLRFHNFQVPMPLRGLLIQYVAFQGAIDLSILN